MGHVIIDRWIDRGCISIVKRRIDSQRTPCCALASLIDWVNHRRSVATWNFLPPPPPPHLLLPGVKYRYLMGNIDRELIQLTDFSSFFAPAALNNRYLTRVLVEIMNENPLIQLGSGHLDQSIWK